MSLVTTIVSITLTQRPIKGTLAISVDPDQNAASDQVLHCLH